MTFTVFGRWLTGLVLMGGILAVAGCQPGATSGGLKLPGIGSGSNEDTTQERITVQELTAYCPSLALRDTKTVRDSYARGGEGDPSKLNFRASLTDATRSCRYSPDMINMTVALAGRVVPGPAGVSGSIRLPIRITIFHNAEEIFSRTYNHEVTISDTAGATQFVFSDDTISIPLPTGTNYYIYAEFVNK